MSVSGLWRTIMSSIIRHPFCGLIWVMCYGISKVEFMLSVNFGEYERGFFGTISKPLTIQAMGRRTNWKYTGEYKVNQKGEREHEASQ